MKTEQGNMFMVPYEIIGATLWYNKAVTPEFDQAPVTWDEFVKDLDTLKAKGRTPIALDGDITDYCSYWIEWMLLRGGGAGTISKAVADASGAGFDAPIWKKSAQTIVQLVNGGYFPQGFQGSKFPTQQAAWADQSSKTDVILMGTWLPSEATASLTKAGKDPNSIKFGSFPFPSFGDDAGAGLVEIGPVGFAVPKKARKAAAAKKFIAWFMQKEQLGKIASDAKNLTPRTDIEPPAELKGFAEEYKNAKSTVLFTDGISVSDPKWVTDIWQPSLSQLFGGKLTADAFLGQLKSKTVTYHKNK